MYRELMRTTLSIDDRVLVAARSGAHARGTTIGEEVSRLALMALEAENERGESTVRNQVRLLPSPPGHVITEEMVAAALLEEV